MITEKKDLKMKSGVKILEEFPINKAKALMIDSAISLLKNWYKGAKKIDTTFLIDWVNFTAMEMLLEMEKNYPNLNIKTHDIHNSFYEKCLFEGWVYSKEWNTHLKQGLFMSGYYMLDIGIKALYDIWACIISNLWKYTKEKMDIERQKGELYE